MQLEPIDPKYSYTDTFNNFRWVGFSGNIDIPVSEMTTKGLVWSLCVIWNSCFPQDQVKYGTRSFFQLNLTKTYLRHAVLAFCNELSVRKMSVNHRMILITIRQKVISNLPEYAGLLK